MQGLITEAVGAVTPARCCPEEMGNTCFCSADVPWDDKCKVYGHFDQLTEQSSGTTCGGYYTMEHFLWTLIFICWVFGFIISMFCLHRLYKYMFSQRLPVEGWELHFAFCKGRYYYVGVAEPHPNLDGDDVRWADELPHPRPRAAEPPEFPLEADPPQLHQACKPLHDHHETSRDRERSATTHVPAAVVDNWIGLSENAGARPESA